MRHNRIGALAGPVYVAGALVGNGLTGVGRDNSDTAAGIMANLQAGISVTYALGFVLELTAFVALAGFISFAYRILSRAEGPDGWLAAFALVAGLLGLIVKFGSAAQIVAQVYRRDDISAEAARTLSDINFGAFIVDGFALGLFVVAMSLCARETSLLGGRTTAIGLSLGTLAAIAAGLGLLAPAAYFPLAFLGCLVWVAVVGIMWARRAPELISPST